MARHGKLNSAGVAEMLNSPEITTVLDVLGEIVLGAAKSGAPVVSGEYRDSLHLEHDHTDRNVVRVVAGAPYSMQVEAEHGVLARAVGAIGGA